ncbi:MAG: GspE/PulE family protein [Planctomycetota bacterium]
MSVIDSPTPRAPALDPSAFRAHLRAHAGVSDDDLRLARAVAKQQGVSEVKAILDLGLLSEDVLADHLARALDLPRWRLDDELGLLASDVPASFLESASALLLEEASDADEPAIVRCVLADPSDRASLNAIGAHLSGAAQHTRTEFFIGTHKDVSVFLLREQEDADEEGARTTTGALDIDAELAALRDQASEAPVVRFFNQAVERAMDLGASDIHFERFDRRTALRYRVDGILIDQPAPPPPMYEPLLVRLKIMANLDIAERRRAQDGRIRVRLRGRQVDIRLSIVPTMYGQDAVLRIQDRQRLSDIDLTDLGFADSQIDALMRIGGKSHGILLITGPTGSGKTTTLYAMLRRLVSVERKVITVEDPVEYAMEGVTQIQVNSQIGLTFGGALRNILRHDPDVILVGEIRDAETAEIAFQASLTGHLVLSTLHTNDVPGTFVRLVDMGVEPYLVNAAVEGVSAQRLLRRVCATCGNDPDARATCKSCAGLGYRGRVAVMEFATSTRDVKQAMLDGAEEHNVRAALVRAGFRTMREEAHRLIDRGLTDQAEVIRVLGHPEASAFEGDATP